MLPGGSLDPIEHISRHCCFACRPPGSTGLRPWKQLELLQEEIAAYSPALAALPSVVVANKVDLLPRPARVLCALRERTDLPVLASSALDGTGVPELLRAMRALWAGEGVEAGPSCAA